MLGTQLYLMAKKRRDSWGCQVISCLDPTKNRVDWGAFHRWMVFSCFRMVFGWHQEIIDPQICSCLFIFSRLPIHKFHVGLRGCSNSRSMVESCYIVSYMDKITFSKTLSCAQFASLHAIPSSHLVP
jgi:hypothetical protein